MNEKQDRFAQEYMVDLNGAQAAIRAGYSAATAKQIAYELLDRDDVQGRIAQLQAERSERTRISADRIFEELSYLGMYDAGEIGTFEMKGPKDIATMPEHLRRAVVGWGWDKDGRFTLKLAHKQPALAEMGKHRGVSSRQEVTGPNGGPIEMTGAVNDRVALALLRVLTEADG